MSDADNLEIKKRARRRLVGAIALALLAAIVLPMMMDQEPHPAVQDIQVTIPDRDARRPLASAEPAAVPAPLPIPEEDEAAHNDKLMAAPEAQAPAAEPPAAEPAPSPAATPRPASTPPVPRQEPPARPTAAPEPRPPVAAVDEEARVRAILSGQPVPPRGEAFIVQVGAFSDAGKAGRLADELKAQGFQAYTERAGSVTRVRVGPIAGRAAADAVLARLKAGGHQAVLQPR
ncbi:SPOR domain-containing protein [Thauera sp. WH-1]|uniref:SPOR domain-containing protein n=1 Tax=Thauera sp. WH-1 TaxID=3398230 RepID=UPI0039FD03E5